MYVHSIFALVFRPPTLIGCHRNGVADLLHGGGTVVLGGRDHPVHILLPCRSLALFTQNYIHLVRHGTERPRYEEHRCSRRSPGGQVVGAHTHRNY